MFCIDGFSTERIEKIAGIYTSYCIYNIYENYNDNKYYLENKDRRESSIILNVYYFIKVSPD